MLTSTVSETFIDIHIGFSERFEIHFVEIGIDENHVHFLIQSVSSESPKMLINEVKIITANEIFRLHLEVKRIL